MRQNRQTKPRPAVRVKEFPPSLEEAVFAAQGLTDDVAQQAEIAAELMDVPVETATALVQKLHSSRRHSQPSEVAYSVDRSGAHRAVVVERKPSYSSFRKPMVSTGGATVERQPFRNLGGGQTRTLLRLGGSGRI